MAPIVKTLPSYIKDSQHALEIVRDFNFLGQGYGYCISFYCHSPFCRSNIFFDQRTVKEPSSETRFHLAKLVLIIAFSWSCQIFFQFPYPFTSHEWLRENLSLQYQYNIKHRSDENKVKYQLRIISWSNTKFSKLT